MTARTLRQRLWERFILHRLGEWWAAIFLFIVCLPLLAEGNITFSDLAFGKVSDNYLNYVIGVFNEQLGTPNWFNLPRLLWISPFYLLSVLFDSSGHIFLVSLIYGIFLVSAFSFGSLMRRLSDHRGIVIGDFGICMGAIFYALNPWALIRIQHIFLLCGYALVPLALSWTWRVLGRESWDGERPFTIRPTLSELRYHLTLGLIVSASFAGIHFGIFIILCMGALGVTFALRAIPTAIRLKLKLRWFGWFLTRAMLAGGTFLLFAAYWVLPFVLSIVKGVRPSQNNVNAIETVATFSRASALENIMLGVSYWWPMFQHKDLPGIFWYAGWIVVLIAVLGVFYSKRWFVGLGTMTVFLVASGTFFHPLASTYISMVFDSPYPFGDMIRDPNKLYGVAALPMALLFGWGIESLRRFQWKTIPILQWEGFLFLCLWLYPIYDVFMLGFYAPVEWPSEYEEMYQEIEKISTEHDGDIKVLYLPVADFAIDKRLGYTSPDFNNIDLHGKIHHKATGDHVAFDTRQDTIFPFEGNDINVMYFLLYFHHLMDEEDLQHVGALVAKGGITHIVMRQDHTPWRERYAHYQEVLDQQTDLEQVWSNDMMSIYEVQEVQPDADPLHHLIYSAGGLERLTWYPRMFNRSSKQFNVLFPYSSHYQTLDILREGDAVETTDLPDLALIQLPKDRFVFAADKIVTASPHLRWSKIVVSGHDWQYLSHYYKIKSDQFNFDMGSGVAFTTTTVSVPPEAYITPNTGKDLVAEPFTKGARWFTPYEDMDIAVRELDEPKPQSVRVVVPDDGMDIPPEDEDEHIWRMVQSEPFTVKPQNLYHITGRIPRVHLAELELRVAMYSEEGHLLDTVTAEIRTTIPEPPLAERKKSFLTPPKTAFARLEIRARNRRPGLLEFEVHDIRLHDLKTYSDANLLPLELKERSGEQDGKLWVRLICSNQGGQIGIHLQQGEHRWMETLDTRCNQAAHFTWKYVNTPAGLDRTLAIENIEGINAINALLWTSHEEYSQLIDRLERELSDKTLFHIVDSSMFEVDQALPNHDPDANLVSGTMMYSLNGNLKTTVDIVHRASYAFKVQDYLPNPSDHYTLFIWKKREGKRVLIYEDTISTNDPRRVIEQNDLATTTVTELDLNPGQYDIQIDYHSEQPSLLTEQDFGNLTAPQWITADPDAQIIKRILPPQEQNWASLNSPLIPVNPKEPLLLWFQARVENARECHTKLVYMDEQQNEIKVVYVHGIESDKEDWSTVQHYEEPPENAAYLRIQFLGKHILTEHDTAAYEIKDLRLWTMKDSPAVDALLFERAPGVNLDDSPAHIEVVKKKLGKRDILVSNAGRDNERTFTRFVLYESPIKHWDFYYNQIPIEGFAVNGIGFGVNVPVNNAIIYAEVPLNRVWRYGIVIGLVGFLLLGILSSIKLIRRIKDFLVQKVGITPPLS